MVNNSIPDSDRILRRMNQINYQQTCTSLISTGLTILGISMAVMVYIVSNTSNTAQVQSNAWLALGAAVIFVLGIFLINFNKEIACLELSTTSTRRLQIMGLIALKNWRIAMSLGFLLLVPAFISLNDGKLFNMQIPPLTGGFFANYNNYFILSMIFFFCSAVLIFISQYWDGRENRELEDEIVEEGLQMPHRSLISPPSDTGSASSPQQRLQ